ncbi:MAG TPA: M20/M25/M40 family metallo-hydrolase, partial [Dehalococcoidia bacterium]
CPAKLSPAKTKELVELAKRAFRSLDLYDFARVDVRMDKKGKPYILEINSMASLGLTGTYVHAAKTAGYTYDSLINTILDVAAVRNFGPEYLGQTEPSTASARTKGSLSTRVRSFLRSQAGTIEDNVRRMVEMRTPAREVERVNAFGDWMEAQMKQLGFEAQTYPGVNVGVVRYFTNHNSETNDVLILSHLDTAGDTHEPFREEGTRLYGTGVAESKGGLAVMLAALRALRFARVLRRVKCGVLLTTDDTLNGARSKPIVEELAPKSRHMIGLKCADLDGSVVVSRSGRATYQIEVDYPRRKKKPSQAEVISRLLNQTVALQRLASKRAGIRVGVTHVDVKAAFGRLPERAEAGITVRFDKGVKASDIEKRIREIVSEGDVPGVRLQATGQVRRPPMERSKANQSFFGEVERIAKSINISVQPEHRPSSSDICFAPASVPKVDGLVPLGNGVRTDDEYILRNSLVDRAALLAHVIHFCATGSAA